MVFSRSCQWQPATDTVQMEEVLYDEVYIVRSDVAAIGPKRKDVFASVLHEASRHALYLCCLQVVVNREHDDASCLGLEVEPDQLNRTHVHRWIRFDRSKDVNCE